MPWRAPFLFLLLVHFTGARSYRDKRQFSPHYQHQRWASDPVQYQSEFWSQQQPYHNHQQRHIYSQQQSQWNWNADRQGYPQSSYQHQQSGYATGPPVGSGYARPPINEPPVRSSYGRPPIIEEQKFVFTNDKISSPQSKEEFHNIGPQIEPFPTATQDPIIGSSIDQIPPSAPLDKETKEPNVPVIFGVDISKGNVPIQGGTFTTPSGLIIDELPVQPPSVVPTDTPSTTPNPFESPSTTANPFEAKPNPPPDDMTTADIITEIIATASPSVTFPPTWESSTPISVDAEQQTTWTPAYPELTQEPNIRTDEFGRTILPVDFVPTEVPAATAQPQEVPDAADFLFIPNGTVILRSPPLPKEVAEKLKQLGFSELKKS